MNIRKFDYQMADYIFIFNLCIGLLYIGILWGTYSAGSDRIYLNKELRTLSLFTILFTTWSIAISSIIYVKTNIKKYLFFSIITILLSAAMGSKGIAIVNVFIFMFFYFQLNSFKTKNLIKFSLMLFLLLIVPTQLMYGNALEVLIHRVFMSGDIYLFSFVIGDYTDLIGYYDPIKYLLHPYSSLIGIRGYDFPLGAQIIGTANIPVTGVGPQDHMTILALTFFNNCLFCIILFSCFFGLLIVLSTLFAFYFFSLVRIHLFFRAFVFTILYTTTINIFVGVNAYSFSVVLIILASFLYISLLLLKNISYKGKSNYDKQIRK